MNTCGTCKHFGEKYEPSWYDEEGEEVPAPKLHICNLMRHLNGYDDEDGKNAPFQIAGVIDGSGYHAAFCVSEEFGCNQWQAR